MAKTPDDDLDALLDLTSEDVAPAVAAPVDDVDALLDTPLETAPAPAPLAAVEEEVLTPSVESDEIARLRAELAEASKPPVKRTRKPTRPKPESQLTPEEREARDLQDQIARAKTAALENAEDIFEDASDDDTLVIHFLEDGLTFAGRVWYKGQEAEFALHGEAYEQTKDIHGKSWLDLADDEYAQSEYFGRIIFRKGPWPGKRVSVEEMSAQERQRRRSVPVL